MKIMNNAGECVATAGSDAEAVRWWKVNGLPNDWLEDTGELLSELSEKPANDA